MKTSDQSTAETLRRREKRTLNVEEVRILKETHPKPCGYQVQNQPIKQLSSRHLFLYVPIRFLSLTSTNRSYKREEQKAREQRRLTRLYLDPKRWTLLPGAA